MTKKELQKKCPKPLQELTLLDRFLFDTAMGDPQICQNVLGIILNEQKVSNVTIGIAEKTLEPYYDSRAVRLDLLAFDESDTVYDAEAQKKNKGKRSTIRRSRLYQAHIDVNLLEPGETNFGKLNDTYVIFICPFYLFGYNKYKYTFHMTCDEIPGLRMDDIKSNQEVGVKYMRMWEELYDAKAMGRAEGKAEGKWLSRIEQIRANLKKGRSLDLIADFLEEKQENVVLISNLLNENPQADNEEILELLLDSLSKEDADVVL